MSGVRGLGWLGARVAVGLALGACVLPGCIKVQTGDDAAGGGAECRDDSDCARDERCTSAGQCKPEDSEPECEDDADCDSGEVCNASEECVRAPTSRECTTLCDFFSQCSRAVSNCAANCSARLTGPEPCATALGRFITCLDEVNGVCGLAAEDCFDEDQEVGVVCE